MYTTGFELTKAMYKRAIAESSSRRKDHASMMLDYYNNGQLDYIKEQIRNRWRGKYDPSLIMPSSLNIVKKIIRNIAMVYLQDAVRSLDGTETDAAILSEIETTAALPVKMKLANRYAKLLGVVLLRPVWRNGRMELDILTPDVIDVDTGDTPEELRAVQVTHYSPVGDMNEVTFSLWTSESIRTVDANGHQISEEENPYGILPFVPCWSQPVTDFFWQRGADDLIIAQDNINAMLTHLGYTIDFQSHSTAVLTMPQGAIHDANDPIATGPGSVVIAYGDSKLEYVSPKLDVDQVLHAIDYLMKEAAVTNGLPAAIMATEPSDESGVARIVGNRELEEMRSDDVALFAEYERRLFDVFRIVWNTHNANRKLSDSAVFQIDFSKNQQTMTATEQTQNWERLMGMGILSPVDIIIERNPDLTRDEAKARLLEIHDELKEFSSISAYPA